MAESAQQRYDRWVNDTLNVAQSRGYQVDPAAVRRIAQGGIAWAAANGLDATGFDLGGATPNTLNPGQAAEFLSAGGRPDRYHTDARGLTEWGGGAVGPSPGNGASGWNLWGHNDPDWGGFLGNPVQPPATAAFDSGPGGPLPSTPSGTIFPGAGGGTGGDPYAGYGAAPQHWADALQAELGGHTGGTGGAGMSIPNPATQTGYGAPAGATPAPGGPGASPLPGSGAPGGLNAYLGQQQNRGGREQALMQALGVAPGGHSLVDEFYRSLFPVLESLYSLGALGGASGQGAGHSITDLINQFGGMLTQPGDFWGGVGGKLSELTGAPGFQAQLAGMTPGVAQGYASDIAGLRAMAQGSPFATDAAKQAIADSMAQYQQANLGQLAGQRGAPGNLWAWLTGAEDPYAAYYR